MAAQGRNQGFHVLDDFVCEAIHAPSVPLANPTNQGGNEGMSVVEELVVDVGTQAEVSEEEDDHQREQKEKERAFETALAAFRSGKQESLAAILQVGYDFLHSRRGTWLKEVRKLGQLEEEDVIMDVVASLPSRIKLFAANDIISFHRWLAVVARHRVIDLVRREVRHKHELLKDTPDPDMPSPLEPLVAQEAVDRLLAAISDLPTDYRAVFAMRLSGTSLSEISDLLGISPSQTAARFHRLFGKLRDQFAAREDK
jgi:RNA polymerase sigma factor (sigma-70 family)